MQSPSTSFTLIGEPSCCYFVYPSWAQFSYRWDDLPQLLGNPLASPYTDPASARYSRATKVQYWKDFGWPTENIEKARFFNGPCGGGIICGPRGRWIPTRILGKEANLVTSPLTVRSGATSFHVCYLEPYDDRLRDYFAGKKRTKLYLCKSTPEHIESDPNGIYWAVGIKKGRRTIDATSQLPEWAQAFDVEVRQLPEVPRILRDEMSPWFAPLDADFVWFKVTGEGNGAGYHYAIVEYLAMHLRWVVGPRMEYMHLLSRIEGKPRVRYGPRTGEVR